MKIILIIIGVVVLFLIIKSLLFSGKDEYQDPARPSADKKPSAEKQNDKLVVIRDADYDNLKKALNEFCNMYNKEKFQAMPRLTKVSDMEYAITFPYDIDFETYCYLINYLLYPMDIKWKPNVIAWTTTKRTDQWITEKSADKKVMLFIPEDDSDHDVVFLTTEDNIGYKLGFAIGEEKQPLKTPKRHFISPTLEITSLSGKQSEDFK